MASKGRLLTAICERSPALVRFSRFQSDAHGTRETQHRRNGGHKAGRAQPRRLLRPEMGAVRAARSAMSATHD